MKKYILSFIASAFVFIQTSVSQISVTDDAGTAVTTPISACLSCPGSIWNNEPNVYIADGNPSDIDLMQNGFCFQSTCYYSRFLLCSQFGFSIPGTATILGIEINILRDAPAINIIKDTTVQLVKNGTTVSSNYRSAAYWPLTYTNQLYGGPADLWGLTWTPADINNPTTAMGLAIYNQSTSSVSGVNVDHVSMTVYYSVTTGVIESQTSAPDSFSVNQVNESSVLFSFNISSKTGVELNLYDLSGKLIYSKEFGEQTSGMHKETVSTENLQSGIYLAQYIYGDKVISRKFNVQK